MLNVYSPFGFFLKEASDELVDDELIQVDHSIVEGFSQGGGHVSRPEFIQQRLSMEQLGYSSSTMPLE